MNTRISFHILSNFAPSNGFSVIKHSSTFVKKKRFSNSTDHNDSKFRHLDSISSYHKVFSHWPNIKTEHLFSISISKEKSNYHKLIQTKTKKYKIQKPLL